MKSDKTIISYLCVVVNGQFGTELYLLCIDFMIAHFVLLVNQLLVDWLFADWKRMKIEVPNSSKPLDRRDCV